MHSYFRALLEVLVLLDQLDHQHQYVFHCPHINTVYNAYKNRCYFLGWARQERSYGQEGNPWIKGFINCYFISVICLYWLYGDIIAIMPLLCLSAAQGKHGERGMIGLPGLKGDTVGFILCCNL